VTCLGWKDPRTDEGELICEERFGRTEVEALKVKLGSYAAAGQLQQRPAPLEGGMCKRTWWKYWLKLPDNIEQVILSLDATFRGGAGADYVAIQAWAKAG